jgi:hypothetical protein
MQRVNTSCGVRLSRGLSLKGRTSFDGSTADVIVEAGTLPETDDGVSSQTLCAKCVVTALSPVGMRSQWRHDVSGAISH